MVALRRASGAKIGARAKGIYHCEDCRSASSSKIDCCKECGSKSVFRFDSKAELTRWYELKMLQRGMVIHGLQRQVSFDLMALGANNMPVKFARYVADFVYEENGKQVIEDVKGGAIDPVAALKLKIMAAMGKPVRVIVR